MRGGSRSSRTLEWDAVDANVSCVQLRSQGGSMRPVSDPSAPDERHDRGRRSRVVLASVADAKSCGGLIDPTGLSMKPFNPQGDGGKKELVAGESTKEAVKTIAQGRPDASAYTCGLYPCAFFTHRGPRVRRAPGLPCALFFRRDMLDPTTRASCAARRRTCVSARHCERSEAIQSLRRGPWIASLRSQ